MSRLELFANELLFDIFQFLNTAHLLHAFLDLNSRFNHLLYVHFRNHQFNLRSISKQHFDIICQEHLSIIADNIPSLYLSDDDEIPNLCELLLSYGFTFDRFIHLKYLSLYHINSFHIINEIVFQCRSLSYLQNLYLIDCNIDQQSRNIANTINNIWSLPNLIHCVINDLIIRIKWIYQVSVMNPILEYLSIQMIEGDNNALSHLFTSVPHLQRLNINVTDYSSYNHIEMEFSSLISLKTSLQSQAISTIKFLKTFPNLYSLTLEISNFLMNGYDWETFIVNFFPKLKIFRLKMNLSFSTTRDMITPIDELVDSFRTIFWLEEHQWYVRCDCYFSKPDYFAALYTLPYAFNECSYLNTYYSISTKPDQNERYSHNHVQYADQQNIQIDSFQNLKLFNTRFPNIHHFEITLPLIVYSNFLYSLSFNQLTSITVTLNDVFGYNQLQTLINQANQLYLLKLVSTGGGSIERLFQLTSFSIRRLDLIKAQLKHGFFFNHEDCIDLINSPLGRQCAVLITELENQNEILLLIEKMPNLRVLIFRLRKDLSSNYMILQLQYRQLMRWLKQNISLKCSIHINSSNQSMCIWIYREKNQAFSINSNNSISNNRLCIREHSDRGYLRSFLFFFLFFLACYLFVFHIQNYYSTSIFSLK